jgi:hypothetical protein
MVLASLHDKLMGSCQKLQLIDLMKFVRDAFAKQISGASGRQLPATRNVFRVTPNKIAKGALVRNFLIAVNRTDLIERANIWTETSVNAQDLFVNQGSQAKAIKALDAMSPNTGISVFAQAFVIKSINLSNLSRLSEKVTRVREWIQYTSSNIKILLLSYLVIAPQQGNMTRIFEFQAEEQTERFDTVVSPINEISQEYVGGARRPSSDLQ